MIVQTQGINLYLNINSLEESGIINLAFKKVKSIKEKKYMGATA